jgi:hypothetical protein
VARAEDVTVAAAKAAAGLDVAAREAGALVAAGRVEVVRAAAAGSEVAEREAEGLVAAEMAAVVRAESKAGALEEVREEVREEESEEEVRARAEEATGSGTNRCAA